MIDNELDAWIIKISSFGLKTTFLMKSISELQPSFLKMKDMLNVCGEGGEYESLVLDCPLFLNKKICVDWFDIINVNEDDYTPVAYVIIWDLHSE